MSLSHGDKRFVVMHENEYLRAVGTQLDPNTIYSPRVSSAIVGVRTNNQHTGR